ncbi:hypothetical protein [Butyrivibrio sp. AE2032]|jgi:hypothetical protein|uniref:hypothetical protein n=1 Tax=Butyrivibrio sp. AE2032 TaxID=1458463 RepID=UPI0005556D25|nr:hypothetical protein [Butyrivibrio sp. AE2032]
MKSIVRKVSGLLCVAMILALSFSTKSYAGSDWPYYFDFSDQLLSIDAGGSAEVGVVARGNYTYFVGNHTSSGTYIETNFKGGTGKMIIHIGADEQVKNVFFYMYADEDPVKLEDYATIEVYVQNIQPSYAYPGSDALKSYAGNNGEFNAFFYYVNYADLRNAYGVNGDKLLEHYNTFGKKEGRVANRLIK